MATDELKKMWKKINVISINYKKKKYWCVGKHTNEPWKHANVKEIRHKGTCMMGYSTSMTRLEYYVLCRCVKNEHWLICV